MRLNPSKKCPASKAAPWFAGLVLLAATSLFPWTLFAGFAARFSPPRFELEAKPGEVVKEILEIVNADPNFAEYVVRTADWDLNENNGLVIYPPELQKDSCRPWTRIERRLLKLPPGRLKRYRFEIHVPQDSPPGECLFALLIAAVPPKKDSVGRGNAISFPITGRVAIVVYVAVGEAKPKLEFQELRIQKVNGRNIPVALFHNSGKAHGRPQGVLEGEDTKGRLHLLTVSPSPILPGRTRAIPLWPSDPDDPRKSLEIALPIKIKGSILWEDGTLDVDTTLK